MICWYFSYFINNLKDLAHVNFVTHPGLLLRHQSRVIPHPLPRREDTLTSVKSENIFKTRMHSSRMRTVRCSGRLGGGGNCLSKKGVFLGGCLPVGVSARRYLLRGCLTRGCMPGGCTPPWIQGKHFSGKRITDRCKTIPFRNYCCGQ